MKDAQEESLDDILGGDATVEAESLDAKQIDEAAAKLQKEKDQAEVERRAKLEPPPKEAPKTMVIHKRHLCSWCGGYNQHVPVNISDLTEEQKKNPELIVKHVVLEIPSKFGGKGKVVMCNNCHFSIFNNMLGQAQHAGSELSHLRGDSKPKGFYPV